MTSRLRKSLALAAAIIVYYAVHEGAHWLAACSFGTFEGFRLLGLGVQTLADTAVMSDWQLLCFGCAGPLATLLLGWRLAMSAPLVCRALRPSKLLRACFYYTTLTLLLADPLYLCILYRFFGGGDMNAFRLLAWPEPLLQGCFLLVGLLDLLLCLRRVYPAYKRAFERD